MKVFITGATGFVGAHAAVSLRRAGHSLRVLARSGEKARRILSGLGVDDAEVAEGDVTDAVAVKNAIEGCDAVIHAAGLLTFDKTRQQEMLHTNTEGTRLVLESAHARHLDPIVHVSSISALFPPDGRVLTTETEVKSPRDPYAQSKAESERLARAMQERGAPVVCVYPGGVWGPDDPTLGNQITTIFAMMKAGYYLTPPASITIIDVRDLGIAFERMMRPGRGAKRYMLSGRRVSHEEIRQLFAQLTGRTLLRVPVPNWSLMLAGHAGDFLRARTPFDPGAITNEAMQIATSNYDGDDTRTLEDLDLELRPLQDTVSDQIRWMSQVNFLTPRQAGKLAT